MLSYLGNIPVVGADFGERVLPLANFVALHGSCMVLGRALVTIANRFGCAL